MLCFSDILLYLHCYFFVCSGHMLFFFFFFFQAEDGIRDLTVTGVQTCALPISCTSRNGCIRTCRMYCSRLIRLAARSNWLATMDFPDIVRDDGPVAVTAPPQIGRASCRGRV